MDNIHYHSETSTSPIKNAESPVSTPKRVTRNRKKPIRYNDFMNTTPTKRYRERESSSSEDEMVFENCQLKPSALFSNDDVEGQNIFQFKSRHSKNALQNKAKTAISLTPKVVLTPLSKSKLSAQFKLNENTPKQVKDMIKKRIIKEVDSDSADSDFSGSSSDFVPEESDQEKSGTSSDSESCDEDEEPTANTKKVQFCKSKDTKIRNGDSDYVVTPDNYFMMHSSKKITTSDHTLARLKNLNLDSNIDEDIKLTKQHKKKISELNKSYEHLFNRWIYVLSENFNVILFGIGSKRNILHQFQMEKLNHFPCIVVNGYFPSLTIKSILEAIVIDLLENTTVPSNIGDVVNLISTQLEECGIELFLIIHNLDGIMLRNTKAQTMLASISQIKHVHTIASIDHINTPLLWDHSKLSKFKFTWWDVTTFLPYIEETSYENSLLTHRSSALQLSSLKSVYQSLTSNAKGIYNIVIQYQIENTKQVNYQGLPFKDLYSKSREQFLVSSDMALRAQLTEFIDHKLVKMKRTYDGSENLVIPIDNSLLQQFLEQQNI